MSSPEMGPDKRNQSPLRTRGHPTVHVSTGLKESNEGGSGTLGRSSTTDQPFQRTTSTQRLLVLLSNLRTDPCCWLCHLTVGETGPHRCKDCRRLFHKPCWISQRAQLLAHDSRFGQGLPDMCLECMAIADETSRPDNVVSRVGTVKFRNFLLYMVQFVEDKLEKENAGPFAKASRHPVDCDEVLCPAALLRLKQKVSEGPYTTYAQFLADLRGLLHKSIVIHGEDSGYSKAAAYLLESCMQLSNSMDWCEECFERSLPIHGETIIAAILRSLINPCSKLHVVVSIKMMGKMWPALVYRFDGEFVNVRFFGTLEFGRVHKSSVFLLFEDFEQSLPVNNQSQQRNGPDAAYEHALRQYGLHIRKLLLIPECSVEFFPKNTPYDGRLYMKVHSGHSPLGKTSSRSDSPLVQRNAKRLLNGAVKGHTTPDPAQRVSDIGSLLLQQAKRQHNMSSPQSLSSETPPLFEGLLRERTDRELQLNAALQERRLEAFIQASSSSRRPVAEMEHRERMDSVGNRLYPGKATINGETHGSASPLHALIPSRHFSNELSKSISQKHIMQLQETYLQAGPAHTPPSSQSSSRKSADPKRFPTNNSDNFTKKNSGSIGGQRDFPGDLVWNEKPRESPFTHRLTVKTPEIRPRSSDLTWRNGEMMANSSGDSQAITRSLSNEELQLRQRVSESQALAVQKAMMAEQTDDDNDLEPQGALVIDEGPSVEISTAEPVSLNGIVEKVPQPRQSPAAPVPRERDQVHQAQPGSNVQTQLMDLLREVSEASETQHRLMEKIQAAISASSRECLRMFTTSQEKLEAMCQNQFRQSQELYAKTTHQLQAVKEWMAGAASAETQAYKRGRQDALRNRANWIDKTKQSLWCCVCHNQAQLLCCGVTLYCSQACQSADYSSHRDQCRRVFQSNFEDTLIQTPYGALSTCQTFPHPDLNTPSPSDDQLTDEIEINADDSSPSSQIFEGSDGRNSPGVTAHRS